MTRISTNTIVTRIHSIGMMSASRTSRYRVRGLSPPERLAGDSGGGSAGATMLSVVAI